MDRDRVVKVQGLGFRVLMVLSVWGGGGWLHKLPELSISAALSASLRGSLSLAASIRG